MQTTTRILKGLAALVGIILLILGIPAALWAVAGSPIPDSLPSWDTITATLSRPDVTGSLTLTILKVVGWLAWATFAIAVIIEIPSQLRGVHPPNLRGLGMQQRAASVLVAAVIAMLGVGPIATTTAMAAPAQAAPAAVVQTAEASTSHQTLSTSTSTSTSTDSDQREQQSGPTTRTYTVQPGDSLWRIAEHELGDGARFQEIADLNYGATQPGGYALDSSHWIDPGWTLEIPTDGAPVDDERAASGEHRVVVEPGDSLSKIAQRELGDVDRWKEIYDASTGIEQPGGERLTDPALIQPGWILTIPGQAAEAAADEAPADDVQATEDIDATADETTSAKDVAPEPAAEEPPVTGAAEAAEETVEQLPAPQEAPPAEAAIPDPEQVAPTVAADEVDQDDIVDEEDDQSNVRTATGVGGLLAAGVLGLLSTRRALARRRRRAGERITMPAPDSGESVLEAELRAVADPIGVEVVDVALRSMAAWHRDQGQALPDVRAARLRGDYFELYLDQPATLPTPWVSTAERHVWQLTAEDAATIELTEAAATTPAPYPSLVTIGHDEEDAHLLLDLEQLDCLDVRGDAAAAQATLAALGVELATSRWADDVQVTLIGVMDDVDTTALDTGRLRHVSGLEDVVDELEARAADVTRALADVGAESVADARGRGLADDAWTPEILLVGAGLSPEDRRRLEDLISRVPRVGVAAVTTDAQLGEWVLDLDASDPSIGRLDPAGLTVRPQQVDHDTYTHLLQLLDQENSAITAGPRWAVGLGEVEAPALEDLDPGLTLVTTNAEDDLGEQVEDVSIPEPTGPIVRILGDVEIAGADGTPPASTHLARTTELITYLALHPTGVTTEQLTAALWPSSRPEAAAKTRPPAISRARRWITPEHLPRHGATKLYRVDEVTTDYDIFLTLVGDDITTTSTTRLSAALDLVRGRPFQSAKATTYVWSESLEQEIMAAVVDVAHEVATRALTTGDAATARRAAEAGRRIDPADERGWRDGIRAEWAAGRREAATRLVSQLQTHLTTLDVEPEPETAELLADFTDRIAN